MNIPPPVSLHRDPADFEPVLEQFEEAWQAGAPPQIADFLPGTTPDAPPLGDPNSVRLLEELIKIDLDYRWRIAADGDSKDGRSDPLGARPLLTHYLRFFPELGPIERISLELISEEYRVRHLWGDRPPRSEYVHKFPQHAAQLERLLGVVDSELRAEAKRRSSKDTHHRTRRDDLPPDTGMPVAQPVAADPWEVVPTSTGEPVVSQDEFVQMLQQPGMLTKTQQSMLSYDLPKFPSPRVLAKELIDRGWLSAFQVNKLMAGKSRDLMLGPHILLERLGEGGTGQVFKARQVRMERTVAIKIIRKELVNDPEVVSRFYRETRMVSQLSHPNVVHAIDAGPIGSVHVLVMEYVDGTDLSRLVRESGPLPILMACNFMRQAAVGLQHVHKHGLVHRDIKPSNLLVTGLKSEDKRQLGSPSKDTASVLPPVVKIADLGLARLDRPLEKEWSLTLTPQQGAILGTPDYLAPEQAWDCRQADIRADIYGLGCTFWYLLIGQPPFPGGTLAQKWMRHQQAELAAIEHMRPDLPEEVALVLRKMLAKRPEDRFQDPTELAIALDIALGIPVEATIVAAPEGLVYSEPEPAPVSLPKAILVPPKPVRNTRRTVLLAAGASLAILVPLLMIAVLLLMPPDTSIPTHLPFNAAVHGSARQTAARNDSVFDDFRAKDIPELLRLPDQPPELVGIHPLAGLGPDALATLLALSPDDRLLAYTSRFNEVALWDVRRKTPLPAIRWEGPRELARSLTFSPCGRYLAYGIAQEAELWSVEQKKPLKRYRNMGAFPISFSADSRFLAVGAPTGFALQLIPEGETQPPIPTKRVIGTNVVFSPDRRTLGYTALGPGVGRCVFKIRDYVAHEEKGTFETLGPPAAVFSPTGKVFAYRDDAGFVHIVDFPSLKERTLTIPPGQDPVPDRLLFAHNGRTLIGINDSGKFTLWDRLSLQKYRDWQLHSRREGVDRIIGATVTADGRHLIVLRLDAHLYVFRLPTPPSQAS